MTSYRHKLCRVTSKWWSSRVIQINSLNRSDGDKLNYIIINVHRCTDYNKVRTNYVSCFTSIWSLLHFFFAQSIASLSVRPSSVQSHQSMFNLTSFVFFKSTEYDLCQSKRFYNHCDNLVFRIEDLSEIYLSWQRRNRESITNVIFG